MLKIVVALALSGAASTPSLAQQAPAAAPPAMQPQQYQIVKKRVCTEVRNDDLGSRIASRRTCKTVEERVPVAAGNKTSGAADHPHAPR